MLNPSSEYTAEITPDEHQLIRACILMSSRLVQEKETEERAVALINTLANALSGLNHGALTSNDVDTICASLEAMIRLMRFDKGIPKDQRTAAMNQSSLIQSKLRRGTHG